MGLIEIISAKPVLIGIHLGFAIIGIDAFLWLLGELIAKTGHKTRIRTASIIGAVSFAISWISGGYYYVTYYGSLVKPVIKEGLAPWAHLVFMETKEHIFLFILPLALTVLFLTFLNTKELTEGKMSRPAIYLVGLVAFLGLAVGLMGFIVSAAARWG